MTRAEACRAIATALGYEVRKTPFVNGVAYQLFLNGVHCGGGWVDEEHAWAQVGDFFTDENASARLLDAMPEPSLEKFVNQWECYCSQTEPQSSRDRKTAIVLAAMCWLGLDGTIEVSEAVNAAL